MYELKYGKSRKTLANKLAQERRILSEDQKGQEKRELIPLLKYGYTA